MNFKDKIISWYGLMLDPDSSAVALYLTKEELSLMFNNGLGNGQAFEILHAEEESGFCIIKFEGNRRKENMNLMH